MNQNALGKILLQDNYIDSADELESLLKIAKEKNESLLSVVVKIKKLDFTVMAFYLSKKFRLPYLDLDYYEASNIPDIDLKFIEKNKILPIKKQGGSLVLAFSDPTLASNDIKFQTGANSINFVIVEEDKLLLMIANHLKLKGVGFSESMEESNVDLLDSLDEEIEQKEAGTEVEIEDTPVVKFIQNILLQGIKLKVSDIHFEPYEKSYRVRFRLDGELYEAQKNIPLNLKEKIASRIKVIAKMDISEKRVPQDGRIKLKVSKDKSIDFRVSSLPTIWGEKIVMRILDSSADNLDIDKLGYDPEQKKLLLEAVKRPYGMVLVTGPTGSGKTVSLYSCVSILNKENVNICTAEDPAEINLTGVNQVNMNEKAGLTFASALKSFLRQDPDTILVGEIRDLETADIAIKAAQTGHMVLSTLHTNDAPKTISRLLNMGVKPFNIASSVVLITAQRLTRRLCSCKEIDKDVPVEVLLDAGMHPSELEGYGTNWHVYKPKGCELCGDKGYKGRVGVYQVMPITEEIRKIILREGTDIEIAESSRRDGVLGLREAGLQKVKIGITSLEEVLGSTNID